MLVLLKLLIIMEMKGKNNRPPYDGNNSKWHKTIKLFRLGGGPNGKDINVEDSFILFLVALFEPFIEESFRDESVGDTLEIHHRMKEQGETCLKRFLITTWRLTSLVSGSLHVKLQRLFNVQPKTRWLENYNLIGGSKFFLMLLMLSLLSPISMAGKAFDATLQPQTSSEKMGPSYR